MKKYQIAVIGSAGPEEYPYDLPLPAMYAAAEEMGCLLARRDCIVVCGGKGGIMESVAYGASLNKGIVAAEVSGNQRGVANKYIDVEIVTGDQAFRGPSQLIGMSDAIIALGGGAGTLQELCVAYRMHKPIVLLVGYGGWVDRLKELRFLDERKLIAFRIATNAKEAVNVALKTVKNVGK